VSPPVAASVRSLWADLVGASDRDALYAVDSTLQEVTFVLGPTLVALLGTLLGSSAPLVASGLLGLVGTIALVVHPAVAPLRVSRHHVAPSRVLTRPLVVLLTSISLLVLAFGVLEVGIVAYAGDHHAAHQSGLLLAAWSFGSMLGGFAAGTRATAGGARALPPLLATSAAGFALLAVSPGVGPLYPLVLLAGIAIAPSLGCISGLEGRFAPLGAEVEAFSWLSSGILVGAAIGAALGGQVAQHLGSRVDFVAAAGVALAAGAVTWLLPRTPRGLEASPAASADAARLRTGA
jgi:MFS family permease